MKINIATLVFLCTLTACNVENGNHELNNDLDNKPAETYKNQSNNDVLSYHKLYQSDFGNTEPASSQLTAITDSTHFEHVWLAHLTDKPLPNVDFTDNVIVLIDLGLKPSTAYSAELTQVVELDDEIEVHVKYSTACIGGSAMTRPVQMWQITTAKPIEFKVTEEVKPCFDN